MKINKLIISYISNTKTGYKYIILWVIMAIALMPFNYFLFYLILGSKFHLGIIFLSIGVAKIIIAYLSPEIDNKHFLNLLSYASNIFLLLATLYLLFVDIQNNSTLATQISKEQITETTTEDKTQTIKNSTHRQLPSSLLPKQDLNKTILFKPNKNLNTIDINKLYREYKKSDDYKFQMFLKEK